MSVSLEIRLPRAIQLELVSVERTATDLLRRYLVELPLGLLVQLSPGLLAEARSRLEAAGQALAIRFVRSEQSVIPEEPAFLEYSVKSGEVAGEVQRLRAGSGGRPGFRARRTRGQPVLAALAHGFVAASLAQLGGGIVETNEGAWDPALFPCPPERFLASFMRPGGGAAEAWQRIAHERLRELIHELRPFDPSFADAVLEEIVEALVARINGVRGDEAAELRALEEALGRVDTLRSLLPISEERERAWMVGEAGLSSSAPIGALARLRPTPEESERWLERLGELLP